MLLMSDEFEPAIELASESLRLADELGLDAIRARNLNTLGVARVFAGDAEGVGDLEQAVAIAAAMNSSEEIQASGNLTWVTVLLGDLRRAGELHRRTKQIAERFGAAGMIRWHRAEEVMHDYWEGSWNEALARADDFIREAEAGSGHYMQSACHQFRAAIQLARGAPELAVAEARRATELARAVKDPQTLNPTLAFEARAELAVGRREAATQVADELLAAWSASGVRPGDESSHGAWVFKELGREEELVSALDRASVQTPWHAAARLIAEGDFAGAADVYARMGLVPDEAHARLRAAEELVRSGHRAEAERQLRLALPVLGELRASAWHAEAESLLAASA